MRRRRGPAVTMMKAPRPARVAAAGSAAPPARSLAAQVAGYERNAAELSLWAVTSGRIPPATADAWTDSLLRRGDEALAELFRQPAGRFAAPAAPEGASAASAAFAASRARRFGVRSAPDEPADGDAFAAARARRFGRP